MIAEAISRSAIRLLSRGGENGRLSIFIFHRVLPHPDPLLPGEPTAQQFEWMVATIARSFRVLPLGTATALLAQGWLPPCAAAVTFDDGYADNLTVAWPVLARHGVPATFFIATAFLDGGRMFNDDIIEAVRRTPEGILDWSEHDLGVHRISDAASRVACCNAVLPRLKYFEHERRASVARTLARKAGVEEASALMLTGAQLRQLRAGGAGIGAHTHTHPILELLDDAAAEREIRVGKDVLEGLLQEEVALFAYPNGQPRRDYSARHAALVRKLGFRAAVTTEMTAAKSGSDPFELPRFTPWDRTRGRFALRCVSGLM